MPHARAHDPATSHEAAASITDQTVSLLQVRILALLHQYGPMCDHEILHHYRMFEGVGDFPPASDSGIRSRRSELVDQGRIHPTGAIAYTLTGRRTTVWAATPSIPQQRAA